MRHENYPVFLRNFLGIATLTLCLIFGSLTYSVHPGESFDQAVKVFGLLLTSTLGLLAIIYMRQNRQVMHIAAANAAKVLVFILGILCVDYTLGLPLCEWMKTTHLSSGDDFQPSNVNRSMIAVLFFALPLAAYLLLHRKYRLFAAMIALMLYACFFTHSQSYIFGLIVALMSWGLIQLSPKHIIRCTAIAITALILLSPVIAHYGFQYIPSGLRDLLRSAYPMMRLEIWYGTAQLIRESPWLGHSINTFRLQKLPVDQVYLHKTQWLHPHNAALQLWYNFGIFGAVALVGSIIAIYRAILRITDHDLQQLAYIMVNTALAVACVSYGLWQGWWLGTLILSLFLYVAVGPTRQQEMSQ